MKEIEDDRKAGIHSTPGGYENVVLLEAPDDKAAMNLALRRADRMEVRTLAAVPGDPSSPSWQA